MASPTEITPAQLVRLIGTPNAPVLIDVRTDEDFAGDPRPIPGAVRHHYRDTDALLPVLAGRSAVLYCQKGFKISQGAAALLRARGITAETLQGGQFGWRDAGLPMVTASKLPKPNAQGETLWVTRHRPKVDRIACPWLIRRFVDPHAQFLFVEPSQVMVVAEKFDATPFDVEDVFWSHRGDRCTFDTMLDEFGLSFDALDRLATLVRGADTNRHDLAPEAAGLLAVSLGLSRMYRDDLAQLEAGLGLYDAFYRWARDATSETHTWPTPSGAG
ncbi:sulfurtransferase/chromate resistance protein [Marivita sp. S6314]|uniref:chromate resistance protein ChrB domain-containing protein n=1 Tax=Marivita sp. S6314 TaxID=2926406 RepID=UPI001FF26154|nr:sulfurtransferase/chromate resistance protein [Marivita sp. S6314]MCK0149567.1 sulfurtransferase/chromate resistance protein [Marivita sp. S6314]